MLRKLHIIVTVVLTSALVPLFRFVGLPLKFTWQYFIGYWLWLALHSSMWALVAYAIEQPTALFRSFTRRGPDVRFPWQQISAVLLPAAYLFWVFFLVLSYNDLIAGVRFDGTGDIFLTKVDSFLLGGYGVPDLARFVVASFPSWSIRACELLYVGMFFQIGASIVLLGLTVGLKEAVKFVSAIALAYYLALLFFFLIPATGPYYTPGGHSAFWDTNHPILALQEDCIHRLDLFRTKVLPEVIGADYWIALPCMHLVQPLIVLWFFRGWRRVLWCLAIYDALLALAILLLEQHYLVDLIAAVPVAWAAVAVVDWPAMLRFRMAFQRVRNKNLETPGSPPDETAETPIKSAGPALGDPK
jgi:hypothetical protein